MYLGPKGLISFWMKIGSLMDAVAEEQMGLRCTADGRGGFTVTTKTIDRHACT